MPEINAAAIKEIRDKTGAPIAMIQKALREALGDSLRAMDILKTLGHDAALKKDSRETRAGRIEAYVHMGNKVGVLLELRSETDFVSRSDDFARLAHLLAMHVAAMASSSVEALLLEPSIHDQSKTVGELVSTASATFGEHIEVRRFVRYDL